MPLREYAGNAKRTTLSSDITASSTSISGADFTNWPTGSPGNFFIVIDRGLSNEEKVLCSSRSGNTLTVAGSGRGADSTAAASHTAGAFIEHGLTATDIREVNDHTFDTTNDDHTQYLNNARHDVEARHTFGAAFGTAQTPVDISGAAAAAGAGANPANEAHVHMLSPPACRVFNSTNLTVSHNTLTAFTFNSERFDTDTMHDTSTNTGRITFNTAGVYVVTLQFEVTATTDYQHVLGAIRINGSTNIAYHDLGAVTEGTYPPGMTLSTLYKFAAADFVDATVLYKRTSAGASDVLVNGNRSPEFSAVWVGDGI